MFTTGGGYSKYTRRGGSDVFFWIENLHARYFFGSRDLSRILLGLKKIRVFFWVLSLSEHFILVKLLFTRLKSYKILKRNRTFSTCCHHHPDDDNKSKTFGFFLKFYNFLAL